MTTFVYQRINGRIFAEKWNHDPINSETGKPRNENAIFKKELTDKEKDMSLDELKMVYPFPPKQELK